RRHVVQSIAQGGAAFRLERAPESLKPVIQEESCPLLVRTVSVHLDNYPLWSPANVNAPIHPEAGALQRARICGRELGRFETWEDTELAAVPVQGKGPLDEHQITFFLTSDAHISPPIMRLSLFR